MSNPRKFSEKIAIHQQKQAQQEMEFNDVMRDLKTVVAHQVVQPIRPMVPGNMQVPMGTIYNRVGIGGSLPNFPSSNQSPDLSGRHNMQPLQLHDHGEVNDPLHSEMNYVDPMMRYNRGVQQSNSINSKHNAHGGLVWHRARSARADPSPYHHGINLQPELTSSSWRRTVSDPSIQQSLNALSPRGAQSPPKSMLSPNQRMTKSPDLISGMPGPCHERQGHMRKQANTSSLPDFTSLNLGSPLHNPIGDQDDRHSPSSPTNLQGQFNIPLGPAPRRHPNQNSSCGRQIFPRQISNPEQDNSDKQPKFLMNQLYQQDNQCNTSSAGSPGSPVMPPYSTWSPLAKEVLFSQQLAGLAAARAQQEDYMSQQQMQSPYSLNEGVLMGYRNEMNQYPPPRYELSQIDSQNGIPPNKTVGQQPNGIPDILVTSNNSGLARELGLGITAGSNPLGKEDFNEEILTSVRAGLEPLNFEDYLMLAGANPDAEQAAEDEFRQDRLSFQ